MKKKLNPVHSRTSSPTLPCFANSDPLPDVAGATNGSPCTDAACLADTVRRLGNIADAEACQGDPPEKTKDSDAAGGGPREPQSWTSCSPRPFPGSVPSNKVQPMPVAGFSPHHQRKKSTVVKLSYRRRSYEGDEMTEMSGSAKCMYRPRAGLTLPCPTGEKLSEGCWTDLEPSAFRVRGEGFFKDKRKFPAPDCSPYTPIGADMFACTRWCGKQVQTQTQKGLMSGYCVSKTVVIEE